jgi:hypothetical protein
MGYNWEQGLKAGAGGAMAGSAFGPLGTGVGAGVGLLTGFLGGENEQDANQRRMLMDYYNRGVGPAPQAGPAANSAYSGFRGNQTGLVNRLESMANGQGPSLARQQFEQATDRNMRAQQALASSGKGGPLSQLTLANNVGMLGAHAAQGSVLARTNEQMGAIDRLGGVIAQGRGADEQTNMFNAGQRNNTELANLRARLDAMGLDAQTKMQILSHLGEQNARQAGQPGLGDQILAGGAGMYSMGATQRAQARASQGSAPAPGAGPSGIPMNSTINPFQSQGFNLNTFMNNGGVGQGY